jgi:LuxR family transcriptional regulator, maltose regulon positive regulatory protein
MLSVSLDRTKIRTPRFRSGLIERSELEEQLGNALESRRLVLLVAPSGYGKTAALSRQLERLPPGRAVTWISVDEEDDLQRLLSHLIEALEPLDPPWRLAPEALVDLVAGGRSREAAFAVLSAIEATDTTRGLIVLDNLHAVADARVFEFLGYLLEGLPQNWTLVIASRVEPPLALGRWRAQREVAEFDQTALGFSRKEVQDLWRHTTGREDPEQAGRLFDRTQGWAAGLCLSLEASERSATTAAKGVWHNRRHLFDYLASEVFDDLPSELQTFLLRCSVLSELTVARCGQVSGNPRAALLLEDIERRRLFVSELDGEELTLRLHDLFRDFLDERLRRLHPEEVPALLRCAAKGEADTLRRTLMYLRAGAWKEAQQDLSDAAAEMLADDKGAQVIRIVEQFPADMQASSPSLAYIRGLCAWPNYQYDVVRTSMEHAAAGFDALGQHDDAQHARAVQALALFFCGHMEDARSLSQTVRSRSMDVETETLSELLDFWYEGYHGPAEGPGRRLERVVNLLMQADSAELWFRCMPRVNILISQLIGRPGVSVQIQRLVNGVRAAIGDAHWSLQVSADLTEAWLLLWQGRFAALEAAFQKIEEDSKWLGQPAGLRIRLLTVRVMHQVSCDDRDAARASRDAVIAHASLLDCSSGLPQAFFVVALRVSVALEDWAAVRTHLPSLQVKAGRESPGIQMFARTFAALLTLQEGRIEEALTALRELATRSAVLDIAYLDALVRTRLARAELANGSPAAAWRALGPLIERVAASGNVGQVLGTGLQNLTELWLASWDGEASREGLATLGQWVETARRSKAGSQVRSLASAAAQDAGLSARELQVLALLADSQSNKLIARALNLSPHTVKRHVARILDRLDLSSRMQAADWHRAHFGNPMRFGN